MKFTLSKELTIKGELVKEVELDFDSLTGHDLTKAEKEARIAGEVNPMINFSMKYQAAIAAKLLGITYDDILDLPAVDFSKLTMAVGNFLIS
jgi:hypothetical protein|nr:MAG TPA: tail assembly chaperone protein [Caudoviricetes sp.]